MALFVNLPRGLSADQPPTCHRRAIGSGLLAVDRGIRVYTIGFGTANGGALDLTCAPNLVGREPPGGGGQGFGGGFGGPNSALAAALALLLGRAWRPLP